VTDTVVPVIEAVMVCEEPPDALTVHTAGGASPLAVPAVGSGAAPSVCVAPGSEDVAPDEPVVEEVSEGVPLPVVVPPAPADAGCPWALESPFVALVLVDVAPAFGSEGVVTGSDGVVGVVTAAVFG
jgi:hypothetical protein